MKKILPAFLIVAAMSYYAISQAQTQPQAQTPATTTTTTTTTSSTAENKAPLDERFLACMKNNDCSTQVRLQIIQEETDAMNDHFQKIHQACADANFQDCIDKQKDDVQAWYSAQNNMQQVMRSMGAQDMSAKEPSAGDTAMPAEGGKEKSFWQKIWPFGKNDTNNSGVNSNSGTSGSNSYSQ